MELSKDKVLELFLKTLNNTKNRSELIDEKDIFGVKATQDISLIATFHKNNTTIITAHIDYCIKVIFCDYVEYSNIIITKEEYENLTKSFSYADSNLLMIEKNVIIEKCVKELTKVLG